MRIFDLYEHPTFEVEQADQATVRTAFRRLGVGATVSAIAAIGFWGYYWSDSSPPCFFDVKHSLTHCVLYIGSDGSVLSAVSRLAFGALTIPVHKGGIFEGNERPGL